MRDTPSLVRSGHPYLWIGLITGLMLGVGALMWNDNGAAVFTALVSAALAWCF